MYGRVKKMTRTPNTRPEFVYQTRRMRERKKLDGKATKKERKANTKKDPEVEVTNVNNVPTPLAKEDRKLEFRRKARCYNTCNRKTKLFENS